MAPTTSSELRSKHCVACEGGDVETFSVGQAREQLETLSGWKLDDDGKHIYKSLKVKHFMAGIAFFDRVAKLAEEEGHHPDLHLEGYRHVRIVLSTHAVGGLSENDFILAAKIDELPVELKK